MPRLLTIHILDERLVDSKMFARLTKMMDDIKANPDDVSKILRKTRETLLKHRTSARLLDPPEHNDAISVIESWYDRDRYDPRYQDPHPALDLTPEEVSYLDAIGQKQVADIIAAHEYHMNKDWGIYPHIKPAPQEDHPEPTPSQLKKFESRLIRTGNVFIDTGAAYAFVQNHRDKGIQLSANEAALAHALNTNGRIKRAVLIEEMFENPESVGLEDTSEIVKGLREKNRKKLLQNMVTLGMNIFAMMKVSAFISPKIATSQNMILISPQATTSDKSLAF